MTSTNVAVPASQSRRTEPEWVVVVVVVVVLVAGWLLKTSAQGSTIRFTCPEISLSYPESWLSDVDPEPGTLFSASNMRSGSLYSSNVTIRVSDALPVLPVGQEGGDSEKTTPAVTAWSFQRGQELSSYRVLGTASADLGGRPSAMIHYAYVSDPVSSPFRKALPVVVEAVDYLVPLQDKTLIVTVAADGMRFGDEDSRWFQPILSSVSFAGE